jgi:hypothetical protein
VAAGIARYAGQFMQPGGLDRVSVVVPDETGEGPAFLATDVSRPDDLADALDGYNPAPPNVTPLQAMLTAAVDHLAAGETGRFRAVLLYTDGARLDRQLDFPALIEAAQAADVTLYVAILGAEAAPEEIANVERLTGPTNGLYAPMPEPEAADPLYEIFRTQGQQTELTYRSAVRQNGTYEVSVSLGNVRDAAEFELTLAAPVVTLEAPATIRRAGSAVDTPLALLQPAVLPLTVRVEWPDGRPRALTELLFRVDGAPQPVAADLAPDADGLLALPWDISDRDAGRYRLEVEVADELGFRASAAPVEAAIEVTRPSPPTPTPAPTPTPLPILAERIGRPLWIVLALMIVAVAAGLLFRLARRRRPAPAAPEPIPQIVPAEPPPDGGRHVAVLALQNGEEDWGEEIEITAADVTIGREPDAVDIVIDDPGVSRLHARIRRAVSGEYWLYDEGSAQGTYLNYERLGLAPRRLEHDDVVRLGRVTVRFRLELAGKTDDGQQTTDEDEWEE